MNTRGLMSRRWVAGWLVVLVALGGGRLVGQVTVSDDSNDPAPPGAPSNPPNPTGNPKLSPSLAATVQSVEFGGPEFEGEAAMVDVIVTYQDQAAASNDTLSPLLGAQSNGDYARLPFKAMRVPVDQLEALANDANVRFVSSDSVIEASSLAARQTARVPGSTAALTTPNAAYQGTGVGVAILDTGVYQHGDFYRTIVAQLDFVNGAGGMPTGLSDPYGHGTHVAGMLGGDGYWSTGGKYRGVATRANVVSLRVLDGNGRGRLSDVLAALDWILWPGRYQFDIRIVNLSFGKGVEEPQALDPLVQAVNAVWDAGVVVIVSAGNFGQSGHYTVSSPGNSRKVITVGALTDASTGTSYGDDFVSTFSSRGPTLYDHVLKPDLVAPGNKIIAPYAGSSRLGTLVPSSRIFCGVSGSCSWRYLRLSGSSMAAAMVSGAAARMLEKDPSLSPSTVKARLMKSARKISGDPTLTGAGVLDVEAAMNASGVMSVNALSPLMGLSASGTTVVYVQNTASLWASSQWSANYIWKDGYLWSNGAPLGVSGYLVVERLAVVGQLVVVGRLSLVQRIPLVAGGGAGLRRHRGPGRGDPMRPDRLPAAPAAGPVTRAGGSSFAGETPAPFAMLASRQPETLAWGQKWLERVGFKVIVATSLDEAEVVLRSGTTEIVIVDDSIRRPDASAAWATLRGLPGMSQLPLLAICANEAEARGALLDGSTDVVRKPLEWQLLSQRAARMVQAQRTSSELATARGELEQLRRIPRTDPLGDPSAPVDGLTGLPQRRSFERVLESALSGNVRNGSPLAVVFLDLDRFKLINGTYGRLGGSQVLVQVADRLRGCLRKRELLGPRRVGIATAALARVGGDAFSLMVSPVGGREEVAPIAQAVLDALSRPCAVGDDEVYVSASLGVALAPDDGTTAEELLQRAELAMAEAGRRGGGAFCFYSRGLSDARERALKMDRLLRRTLEREELSLHYQPIVEARSRRIVGAEALLRWRSPELGNVPPSEFIPVAEETGFMVDIGKWVLRMACGQLKAWLDEGLPRIRMATNVSLCQLTRGNLPQLVDQALAESGLDPSLLELELSERGVLRSDPETLRQLQAVRRRGVRVSVDDFGTGDSAIAYLKRFPLDTLKVDQSFVAGALTNQDDAAITSAMIAMAHHLRLRVVAEGVEGQKQFDLLDQMDCEELQGFFFSPPVPAGEFRELLRRNDRG